MSRGITCEKVLLDYLKQNKGFHKKVKLYSVAEDWEAETVGRCLRTLAENKSINVDYYDGKYARGLAMYSYGTDKKVQKQKVVIDNGIAKLITYYE